MDPFLPKLILIMVFHHIFQNHQALLEKLHINTCLNIVYSHPWCISKLNAFLSFSTLIKFQFISNQHFSIFSVANNKNNHFPGTCFKLSLPFQQTKAFQVPLYILRKPESTQKLPIWFQTVLNLYLHVTWIWTQLSKNALRISTK